MSFSQRSVAGSADVGVPRLNGVRSSGHGLGPSDHLCWSYEDPVPFAAEAAKFLIEGVELGEQVAFIGESETFLSINEAFVALGGGRDALHMWTVADTYQGGAGSVDPGVQVANYADKVDQAKRDGFSGLRIVAEATSLVIEPDHRSQFVDYEMAVDEFMSVHPFSAMCAYRIDMLGPDAIAELASVHPLVNADTAQFRLFRRGDGTVSLDGEVDIVSRDLFPAVLARLSASSNGGLVLDTSDLTFIDARGLSALDGWAAENGPLVLRSPRPIISRLAELIEAHNLILEATA